MTSDEFRKALTEIGYSQERFAELVGVAPRTGQKWALGEARIPNTVVILLKLFLEQPKTLKVVETMQPLPTRTRADKKVAARRSARTKAA